MGRRRRDHRGRPVAALSRARKADTAAYVEPSARASTVEWTPDAIRAAELYADAGNLRQAADLCDAVLADDQVQGALTTLVGALMGLDLEFEASGDKRRSNRAIKALEVEEDWWKAFPEPELNLLLTWAVLLGVALAEIVWTEDPETGRVPGSLRVWHPRHLRWDGRTRKWMLRVDDAGREIEIVPGDGRWILLAPKGARRPWKNGAWRAIARWWLLKDYAIRDWGGYSERHGTGTLVAETGPNIPAGGSGEKREKLARQLNALGRNSAIAMPPGWSIKLVEATANTAATFEKQIALADRGMTIALHGTNLTNEDGGSYAKALVLGGVHIQVIKSLAEALSTTLHEQHLVFWAEYNFGDRRLAPWPLWPVEPPADLKGKADALGSVAVACTALKALSERVDIDAILEEHGVPLLTNAPPSRKPEATEELEPADDDEAEEEERAASPPPTRHTRPLRLAKVAPPGFMEGQVYADTLADEARDEGARSLRPDLRVVAAVIEGARDYEGLRAALKAAYRGMNPRALAELTQKAILLGELGGRLSAIKDT